MLLPIFILMIIFGMNNARRARARGLNPGPWVIYTIIAFLAGFFIASFLLAVIILVKNPALMEMAQLNDREKMTNYMVEQLSGNFFLYSTLVLAGGFGGYLLIRYLIEKKRPVG